jgi:hypothetical protein
MSEEKNAAKETLAEAVRKSSEVIFGRNLENDEIGLTLGTSPPGEPCEVEVYLHCLISRPLCDLE